MRRANAFCSDIWQAINRTLSTDKLINTSKILNITEKYSKLAFQKISHPENIMSINRHPNYSHTKSWIQKNETKLTDTHQNTLKFRTKMSFLWLR